MAERIRVTSLIAEAPSPGSQARSARNDLEVVFRLTAARLREQAASNARATQRLAVERPTPAARAAAMAVERPARTSIARRPGIGNSIESVASGSKPSHM